MKQILEELVMDFLDANDKKMAFLECQYFAFFSCHNDARMAM